MVPLRSACAFVPSNVAFGRSLSLCRERGDVTTDLHYGNAQGAIDVEVGSCFDRHCFEPQTALLWADEREIKLTPKAAAVLGLLGACAGRPVTKVELFAAVWSDGVVSDDALTTSDMSAARDHEYFCEGLAEELIDALANVDGLRDRTRCQIRGAMAIGPTRDYPHSALD